MNTNINSILKKRFNNTNKLIYVATSVNNIPYIRALTPYYNDGSFYFITDKNSSKVKQFEINNQVALCGEWFNAQGTVINLGAFSLDSNQIIANQLITYCDSWIQLGNVDIYSENTLIIEIKLIEGYVVENKIKHVF